MKKICLPQCPLKSSEMPAVSFVVSLRMFRSFPFVLQRSWRSTWSCHIQYSGCDLFTPASHSPWHLKGHQPQICTLSSRPSSQSFSPSHSHCLAMHLFFEQANWFHKHDESAEGIGRGNFNAINQTKWGGNNNKSGIPYRRGQSVFNQNTTSGLVSVCPSACLFSSVVFLLSSTHQCSCHTKDSKYIYFISFVLQEMMMNDPLCHAGQ